jgi:hypothetical protein
MAAGPAFIKWAQWSSSRPDVFPAEFCEVLAKLHDDAPTHSWGRTAQELHEAFGAGPEAIFEEIERTPIASGSIAQVGCLDACSVLVDAAMMAHVMGLTRKGPGCPGQGGLHRVYVAECVACAGVQRQTTMPEWQHVCCSCESEASRGGITAEAGLHTDEAGSWVGGTFAAANAAQSQAQGVRFSVFSVHDGPS